jgi:hypothetical protein
MLASSHDSYLDRTSSHRLIYSNHLLYCILLLIAITSHAQLNWPGPGDAAINCESQAAESTVCLQEFSLASGQIVPCVCSNSGFWYNLSMCIGANDPGDLPLAFTAMSSMCSANSVTQLPVTEQQFINDSGRGNLFTTSQISQQQVTASPGQPPATSQQAQATTSTTTPAQGQNTVISQQSQGTTTPAQVQNTVISQQLQGTTTPAQVQNTAASQKSQGTTSTTTSPQVQNTTPISQQSLTATDEPASSSSAPSAIVNLHNLSTGAIAGIAVGSSVSLIIIIVVAVILLYYFGIIGQSTSPTTPSSPSRVSYPRQDGSNIPPFTIPAAPPDRYGFDSAPPNQRISSWTDEVSDRDTDGYTVPYSDLTGPVGGYRPFNA